MFEWESTPGHAIVVEELWEGDGDVMLMIAAQEAANEKVACITMKDREAVSEWLVGCYGPVLGDFEDQQEQ